MIMIKKITFVILLCIFAVNNAICDENNEIDRNGIEIDLTSSYDSPQGTFKPRTRTMTKAPEAYVFGHVINFKYFDRPLTIELVDTFGNDVIFSTTVDFGVSSIEVPASVKGIFIIKFINDDMVHWGYVTL